MRRLVLAALPVLFFLLPQLAANNISDRAWAYPPASPGPVFDDYFGTKVPDPYRWLEDLDSPQTRAWVESENKLTFGFLEELPQRAWFRDRLTRLWNYPRFGLPFKEGGQYFFTKNDGLQNQSVLYVQAGLTAAPRVLFDPNALAADGTVALTATAVSHDGRWLAYGTAAAGSDWNEVRIRQIATGQDNGEVIRWIKFSAPSWTRDSRGFFYSRFPSAAVGEGNDKTFSQLAFQKIYHHRLGQPQSQDRLIYEIPAQPKWFVDAEVTEDGRYAIVSTRRGDSDDNLLGVIALGDPTAPDFGARATPLIEGWDAEYNVIGNDGPVLYVQTNLGAPRRRIIAIDLRAPQPPNWKTLVLQSADVIESSALIGGKLIVLTMHDASSRLLAYAKDGRFLEEVLLPGLGSVGDLSGHEDDPEMFYNFTSFTHPATNFRHDLATGQGRSLPGAVPGVRSLGVRNRAGLL